MRLLLHLSLLSFLGLLGLPVCCMRLGDLLGRGLFMPAPSLFQLFVDEPDSPAGLLVDLVKDLEDLFLFPSISKHFSSMSKGANSNRGDATIAS